MDEVPIGGSVSVRLREEKKRRGGGDETGGWKGEREGL